MPITYNVWARGVCSACVLIFIKTLHTAIWAVVAGCILALPVLGIAHRFRQAAIVSAVVLAECLVIAVNGGRCPLTDWAARYSASRAPNFDIYLPRLLAQYNKLIFGLLFLLGEVVVFVCFLHKRRQTTDSGRSPSQHGEYSAPSTALGCARDDTTEVRDYCGTDPTC